MTKPPKKPTRLFTNIGYQGSERLSAALYQEIDEKTVVFLEFEQRQRRHAAGRARDVLAC